MCKTFAAEVLGNIAYHAGKKRIPAHDPELMKLLVGNQIGAGIPVLEAWILGWELASAQASAYNEHNPDNDDSEERAYCAGIPSRAVF